MIRIDRFKAENPYYSLLDIVSKLPEDLLFSFDNTFKKTIADIIWHLAYYECEYFSNLLRRCALGYGLKIESFKDIDSPKNLMNKNDVIHWIDFLISERERNINFLEKNYHYMARNRLIHQIHGEMVVDDVVEKVKTHDKHHFEQVEAIIHDTRCDIVKEKQGE